MSIRTKTGLIIVGTLIIGLLTGAIVSNAVINHRQEQAKQVRTHKGFVERMDRLIGYESEAQREAARPILEETAERMIELHAQHGRMMRTAIDSMVADLGAVLSDEQIARISKRFSPSFLRQRQDVPKRNEAERLMRNQRRDRERAE